MCGIVGVAGKIYAREKDAFTDLLIFSQVRGPHSTGVASVARNPDQDTKMAKALGRSDMLIDYDKRWERVVDFGKKFILGHNRFATQGKVNVKNAHPYNFENIVGCHNGTIPEYRLRDLKKGPDNYGTDSETVLANIDSEPLADVFKPLAGAWAFVWFDRRNNTVNFLRNNDRYLCYCYSKDRETLFWASEKGFLEAALNRNKIEYSTIFEVTAEAHTRWVIPEANKPFEKALQRKILSGVYQSTSQRFPVREESDFDGQSQTGIINSTTQSPGTTPVLTLSAFRAKKAKQFESSANLSNFDGQGYLRKKHKDVYRGFRGEVLNHSQFDEATKNGCCWCDDAAEWGQPVRFLTKDTHICLTCCADETVRSICGAK